MLSDVRCLTPEEEELDQKRTELDELETEMVQRELDLATLLAELQAFEQRYTRIVGMRIAEVDQLEAAIADLVARHAAHNRRAQQRAREAHANARQSATAETAGAAGQPETFEPTAQLKGLFRDLAKRIHPDLAEGGDELPQRTRLMAEANAAYRRGDTARLTQILVEWQSTPETVKGEGPGAELVRVIRKIAQARRRLVAIQDEIAGLDASDLFRLKSEVEQGQADGYDLLEEMACELDDRAAEARRRLEALRCEEKPRG
jgi:hypothetical protein